MLDIPSRIEEDKQEDSDEELRNELKLNRKNLDKYADTHGALPTEVRQYISYVIDEKS